MKKFEIAKVVPVTFKTIIEIVLTILAISIYLNLLNSKIILFPFTYFIFYNFFIF